MRRFLRHLALALAVLAVLPAPAVAERATVAVAANFLTTAEALAADYAETSGHSLALVPGATGKLYAQIRAGAPFDLFLSADAARPARLQAAGLLAPGGLGAYAIGRLALIQQGEARALATVLADPEARLAIANPATAPYGAAAQELLETARGPAWRDGVVFGENVGQTFAFVATGNAPAGLVALSQVRAAETGLSVAPVPTDRHAPIRQDAALLARGADNPAARGFFAFLSGPTARRLIAEAGYLLPE